LKVDVGDHVKAGDVVAVLEHSTQDAQLAQAKAQQAAAEANLANLKAPARDADIAVAQAAVTSAEAALARVQQPARQADINQANAAVRAAQAGLAKVKAGATAEDIEQARLRIEQAKNQLLSVQGQRDAVCGQARALSEGKGPAKAAGLAAGGQCESFRGQTQAAEAAVQIAEQAYQRIQTGPTDQDIAVAQAAVDQAQAGYQRVVQGPTANDIAQAQAAVDQAKAGVTRTQQGATQDAINAVAAQVEAAKAAVNLAQISLDEMTIKAPFDGVVSARNATIGSSIAAGGATGVVNLVSEATEVTLDVETALLNQVKVGDPIKLVVDSWPDTTFQGKVSRIVPVIDTTTRTFKVIAEADDKDHQLKPGMFATVTLLGGK